VSVLKIVNLHFQYKRNQVLLENFSFTLDDRESLLIQGPSGSGKSTLIYLIAGCLRANSGQIWLFDKNITRFNSEKMAKMRRKIGIITQLNSLLKDMDCLENVMMPMLIDNWRYDEAKLKAEELLYRVGLQSKIKSSVLELSGGEEQRVLTARALANDPKIILADEATANLDEVNAGNVLSLCIELTQEKGIPMIWTTHQQNYPHLFTRSIILKKN
jgi:ABC-type lipoprotein export system ATPase subunit